MEFTEKMFLIITQWMGNLQQKNEEILSDPGVFDPRNPDMPKNVARLNIHLAQSGLLMDVLTNIHKNTYDSAKKVWQ